MKLQQIDGFLRRRYLLAFLIYSLDLFSTLILSELLTVLICANLFILDPLLESIRGFFQFLIIVLQIPIFLILRQRFKSYFPGSFAQFVFRWEQENFSLTENRASALLFSQKLHVPVESFFHLQLIQELGSTLRKTSIQRLLPAKPFILVTILLFLFTWNFNHVDWTKTRAFLAVHSLLNPARTMLQFEFARLRKTYLRGLPFEINGIIRGEPVFPVVIEIQSMQDTKLKTIPIAEFSEVGSSQFIFTMAMEGLQETVKIKMTSGSQESQTTILTIVDLPTPISEEVIVVPPAYTEAPERKLSNLPRTVLEGSKIIQSLRFNQEITKFWLLEPDSQISLEQIALDSIQITLNPTSQLNFQVHYSGIHGYDGQSSIYAVKAYPDLPPRVEISLPATRQKTSAGSLDEILLDLRAEDDHMVKKMRLELTSKQRFEMTYISDSSSVDLKFKPSNRLFFNSSISLPTNYFLQEGDTITMNLLLWDSLPGREPVRSTTHVIFVPYYFQEQEEAEAQTGEIIDSLQELTREEKSAEDEIKRVSETLQNDPETLKGPAVKESLEELLRQKEDIQKKTAELEKKMDEMLAKERELNLLNEADLSKMNQIQNLYQDVMREMQMALSDMEQMARQASNLSTEKMSQMLQDFNKDKFSQELDRALESLKKIKAKQSLKKNLEKLNHLAKEHEKISELLSKNSEVKKAMAQELERRFEQVKQELEELSTREGLDPALKTALREQLEQRAKPIQDSYKELSKALDGKDQAGSQEANQKIQRELSSMRQDLEQKEQETRQEILRVNMERLNLFLRETLEHAFFLEGLYLDVDNLKGLPRKQFAARQLAFLDSSSRWLKEQILNEYESNLNFQKTILQVMDMLQISIHSAVNFFESDQANMDRSAIKDISRINNQLTLILLHLKEELQKQQQQGEMSQFFESLEQLAEQQNQIHKGTQSASAMENPAQRQKLLEQLAFQQQLVRKSTERLYENYQEKMDLARGLQGVSKEMEAVEKKLESGESSNELQEKQKAIEYKLLESQSALKEQKEGKERKASQAKLQSSEDGLTDKIETDPSWKAKLEVLNRNHLPKDFKSLVNQYFQAIEQDRPNRR